MHLERNDEVYARALAVSLRAGFQPRCPHLRACRAEWLYPVQGYCVLAESPGWFMVPSIEEHREYCTTPRYGDCCWFRGLGTGELPGAAEAHREEQAIPVDMWQPPDGVRAILGKRLG
jgi:hypothetical protein